jgi:MFS family permease
LSQAISASPRAGGAAFVILGAITFCHLLNDVMQALLPAIYPMLKSGFALSFGQIGFLTLIFQVTASLLQPMVGLYTDHRPQPYSLPLGMACSLLGMVTLAFAPNFPALLAGAALLGIGSSIFHPESSRLARLASGGAHGFAQSFFQVGGHVGSALGRCWLHSSSCRKDVTASPGLLWSRFWGCAYLWVLGDGTGAPFAPEQRSVVSPHTTSPCRRCKCGVPWPF